MKGDVIWIMWQNPIYFGSYKFREYGTKAAY